MVALAARLFVKVVIELSIGTEIWLAVSSEGSVECENLIIATGVSCAEEEEDDCALLLTCDVGVVVDTVVAVELKEDENVEVDVACTCVSPDDDAVPPAVAPPAAICFFTPAASEHKMDPILTGSWDILVPGNTLLNISPKGLLPA
ncbi:MAG: hypothetical protein LQ352_005449 [Teloschistes flavicans]|nr:MAG: hypothetical protein LQ352_005449 [Teloschistes flavicans]